MEDDGLVIISGEVELGAGSWEETERGSWKQKGREGVGKLGAEREGSRKLEVVKLGVERELGSWEFEGSRKEAGSWVKEVMFPFL